MRWTARHVPGVPAEVRDDLVVAVEDIAARSNRADRALEIAGLVGFALRAASRRGASDDRREMVRQGAWVGALVLAFATALQAWAAEPAHAIAIVVGTALTAVVAGGYRTVAIPLGAAALVAAVLADGNVAAGVIVLAAVVAGRPYDARPCPIGAALAVLGTALAGAVLAAVDGPVAITVVAGATLVVPALALAVGWFDPRYAIAATLVLAVATAGGMPAVVAAGGMPAVVAVLVAAPVAYLAMERCLPRRRC